MTNTDFTVTLFSTDPSALDDAVKKVVAVAPTDDSGILSVRPKEFVADEFNYVRRIYFTGKDERLVGRLTGILIGNNVGINVRAGE